MTVLPILGLGLLLLAASSRRSSSSSSADCDTTASAASSRGRDGLIAWVDCAGRAAEDVAELARLLDRAGRRADAEAVRERWNARRAVEDAPPDGRIEDPAEAAAARRALTDPNPPPPRREPRRRRSHVYTVTTDHGGALTGRETGEELAVSEPGAGWNAAEARRLAPMVARSIRGGSGYRTMLRRFQRAAGIAADGIYGPQSRAALRYFGVMDPPPARSGGGEESYHPPSSSSSASSVFEEVTYEPAGES